MVFTAAELAALSADVMRIGAFFRLNSSPPVRIWLGIGPINPGVTAMDPSGAVYSGLGELVAMPAFEGLIGGKAQRVEFTLSGVSDQVLALAAESASAVRFKECRAGFGIMDSTWQMLGSVHWSFWGLADFLRVAVTGASDPSAQTMRTVTLSVHSQFSGRRRRGLSYWTDQDQQQISPGDRFCERTVSLSEAAVKSWPRF